MPAATKAHEAAFPVPDNTATAGEPGMTMREWYAGMALQGLLAAVSPDDVLPGNDNPTIAEWQEHFARVAFGYADAMLAQAAAICRPPAAK